MTAETSALPWWQPHPDSIVGRQPRRRWFPVVNLVWLFWMFGAPWAFGPAEWPVVVLTFASLPVFLWLYFQTWYREQRRVPRHTLAMAVLGLAMIAGNSSWSYVIYAAVALPYCSRGSGWLAWLALLLACTYALEIALGYPRVVALACIVSCAALAALNWLVRINQAHDAELRLSHEEVRRLAATAERERISRDLHDLLGHTLSMVALKSELAGKLVERDPAAARREIAEVQRVAREALAEVRSAVTGMRATELAAELAAARLLLEGSGVRTEIESGELALPADLEAALALVLREAVTNIHRHAQASRALIRLGADDRVLRLTVQDDGRGGIGSHGNGLAGLSTRIAALGGTLHIDSPPKAGTTLEITVPRPRRAAAVTPLRSAA